MLSRQGGPINRRHVSRRQTARPLTAVTPRGRTGSKGPEPSLSLSQFLSLTRSLSSLPRSARRRRPPHCSSPMTMPSWKDGEESTDDDFDMASSMDMEIFETPDTIPEPLYCGVVVDEAPKCMLHQMRPKKCVAFEGIDTGRRFLGCYVQGGVNCGVVQWVDGPWPVILQKCLSKLWEMFHEKNCGRVIEKQAYERELAKVKKENEQLGNQYIQLVEDVTKMFDCQDGKGQKMEYQRTAKDDEDVLKKKKELEQQDKMEVQLEKLKLDKEQRCILSSQADIIRNTRKQMKEIKEDMDLLKEEKKKLEYVIADLLKAGHGSKEKLEKIKALALEPDAGG